MINVYIALGSNLGSPKDNITQAIEALKQLPMSTFLTCSSLYQSKPMGDSHQPDYINAVAAIRTRLDPLDLLDKTQEIELAFGRERKEDRWGSRTLDLDILLYGDCQIETERLTLPHYGMNIREFVLYPLAEIAPNLHLPNGSSLASLIANIDKNGMTLIARS